MTVKRIDETFEKLKQQNRTALVSYIMSYDPNYKTSLNIMKSLPGAGVDIIELGMAFSDPMADGPTIQEAAIRALKAGASVKGTLKMVHEFRQENNDTPVILMGYYNPVHYYGIEAFVNDALASGVDGVILVDLTPEEEEEFIAYSEPKGLAHIKLTAPTTTVERGKKVLKNASGFVYYISVAGITGGQSANVDSVSTQIQQLKTITDLPFVVGFGIKTPKQVEEFSNIAEGVVVGSAFVNKVKEHQQDMHKTVQEVSSLANELSAVLK